MSTTPQPSLDDLRAQAVAAEAPPVETPVVPEVPVTPPDPWQVKTVDGGNYEVQIEGQVFKGTHQQVLNELAKAQYHATHTIKDTRAEIEKLKTQPPAPPVVQQAQQPALPSDPPEVIAARQYLAEETAKSLGFTDAAELRQSIQAMSGVVQNNRQSDIVTGFYNMAPEFPNSEPNVELLTSTLEANGLPLTPHGLRAAHLICVTEGKYKPLSPQEIRVQQAKALGLDLGTIQPPLPAPMVPSTSAVGTEAPFDPYDPKVDLEKVRAWAMKQGQ